MRTQANNEPKDAFLIEPYPPESGWVRVTVYDLDSVQQRAADTYTYDEYYIVMPDRVGLAEEIAQSPKAWLTTGKTLETPSCVSILAELDEAFAILRGDVK